MLSFAKVVQEMIIDSYILERKSHYSNESLVLDSGCLIFGVTVMATLTSQKTKMDGLIQRDGLLSLSWNSLDIMMAQWSFLKFRRLCSFIKFWIFADFDKVSSFFVNLTKVSFKDYLVFQSNKKIGQ